MSILLNENTRVMIQGITVLARFHTSEMVDYGTKVVAGVVPEVEKKLTQYPYSIQLKKLYEETGATASLIFVPPPFAADSIMEAADAGLQFCLYY